MQLAGTWRAFSMGAKSRSARVRNSRTRLEQSGSAPRPVPEADSRPRRTRGRGFLFPGVVVLALVSLTVGVYFAYDQYQVTRISRMVRKSFADRRYEAARAPLARWLRKRPHAAEAFYYQAWQALADQEPREAVAAVDEARRLGFDPERLEVLSAIYHVRADRFSEGEPVLERAFLDESEPRDLVAKALARIYLSSYRFDRAAAAIERWRTLTPGDPQPYLWSNEIASRSDVEPAILIQNYRAALERDPNLDKARLGLAIAFSKDRRFDDAEREFLAYSKRNPKDTSAFLGLGRNAFQQGDIEKASRFFESRLR